MLKTRSSIALVGLAALGLPVAWFGLTAFDVAADRATRTENVSIQILATSNNHGETAECG